MKGRNFMEINGKLVNAEAIVKADIVAFPDKNDSTRLHNGVRIEDVTKRKEPFYGDENHTKDGARKLYDWLKVRLCSADDRYDGGDAS